jgi:glycosyltransferase involved in cell wall biosynthesis
MTQRADVCLVLEGTYPYVAGGVSSWVHHLVRTMPELGFAILHVSPTPDSYPDGPVYKVPDNVLWIRDVPLRTGPAARRRRRRAERAALIDAFWEFVQGIHRSGGDPVGGFVRIAHAVRDGALDTLEFLRSPRAWEALVRCHEEAPDESLLDLFWTWQFAHESLLNVLNVEVPEAGVYHTVSTGYAGVLAAAACRAWQRPMILTEHGIYTKERRIEIHNAEWIRDWDPGLFEIGGSSPFFKRFWNRHFQVMSRICYANAREIFTLYFDNTRDQVADGADPDKIRIIPNGIDVERLGAAALAAQQRTGTRRFTVGFVGRVCPIKDVRTFLTAMRLVAQVVPDLRVRVMGPMEEDRVYAEDCQRLAHELDLDDNVRFEGRVDIAKELPDLDVMVLTSISEAQPLVVLEAGAVGVPVVATDVGSCRVLLEGGVPEDRALGPGGLLTPIASPGDTARAVLELHGDAELRRQMGANLQARVRRYYDQRDMVAAYRAVYETQLAAEVG